MAQTYANIETVYQATFPASQAGKLSDVWYTVDRLDQTGAPSPFIIRNQDGVLESGNGAYAVNLVLGQGRYNIFWEIAGTPYKANEELNVLENIYDKISSAVTQWTGYGGGDRQGIRIGNVVNLTFTLYRNGQIFNPYAVKRVETYATYADAQNSTNKIETITTVNHPSIGLFTYQSAAFSVIGTKFDKIIFELEEGQAEYSFINPFYIREASYTPPDTGEFQVVRVYFNVGAMLGSNKRNAKIEICQNVTTAWYENTPIIQETRVYSTDSSGQVVYPDDGLPGIPLIPTDILTSWTFPETGDDRVVQYKVNIAGKFNCVIEVPSDLIQANFKDLIV